MTPLSEILTVVEKKKYIYIKNPYSKNNVKQIDGRDRRTG